MIDRSERGPATEARAFSRLVAVDDIPAEGLATTIEATPEECAAIAVELDLPTVLALSATVQISRLAGGGFRVGGEVAARITQICVVTLEPFDSDVVQAIDIGFAPAPRAASTGDRPQPARSRRSSPPKIEEAPKHPSVEADVDAPDPLVDGRIDLGAVAEEFLTLALDFYPRKPGVAFTDVVGGADEREPSAFAALERFKDRS